MNSLGVPRRQVVALAGWATLIAVALWWGRSLNRDGYIGINAPPFAGHFGRLFPGRLVVPVAVGVVLAAVGPPVIARIQWRWVPAVAGALSVGWALALHRADTKPLTGPLATPVDYLAGVPDVSSPLEYLRTYTERLPDYPTHVRGHPPGAVLFGWVMEQVGLGGVEPFLVVVLFGWAATVASVLVALRAVAGEAAARRACLPVALAPAAVWVATSSDPLIAGASAVGLAMVVVALARPSGRRTDALAGGGGTVFGVALLLSYGVVVMAAVPLIVALHRRRSRPLVLAAAAGSIVLLTVAAAGFWWFDGLAATRREYLQGLASIRPYRYFVVANLAAFAVASGPALALGAASVRRRSSTTWLLAAGGMAAVLVADLSGMSKAEVERIWLPFVPWVLTVVAVTDERTVPLRVLVAGQLACGIAVQALLRSPW